jgi:ubiquitin-protein ligase
MNKRLLKEILDLQKKQNAKNLLENDYLIYIDDSNINKVYTIIKAPYDSVYKHKFIRLNFEIPENYPYSPPKVTFVNYDGVRIHPTMYQDGQCCSTILNTWGDSKYEKWTPSMGIETILLMFHSFLDNNPYTHEPGGRDDPSYTDYVLYQSWYSCLIKYLQNEEIELFTEFMYEYLIKNINDIFNDINELNNIYPAGNYYTRCFEIEDYCINYMRIINHLEYYYNVYYEEKYYYDESNEDFSNKFGEYEESISVSESEKSEENIKCNICFDTKQSIKDIIVKLSCNHLFHINCIKQNLLNNEDVCPMCRKELSMCDRLIIETDNKLTINPLTKRKIKVNGKTYKYLLNKGIFN